MGWVGDGVLLGESKTWLLLSQARVKAHPGPVGNEALREVNFLQVELIHRSSLKYF